MNCKSILLTVEFLSAYLIHRTLSHSEVLFLYLLYIYIVATVIAVTAKILTKLGGPYTF